jgi:hypothetical protein
VGADKRRGGILWYDFIYNNPGNPDVRGVHHSPNQGAFPQWPDALLAFDAGAAHQPPGNKNTPFNVLII